MKLISAFLLVLSFSNFSVALQHDTCILHVNKDGVIMESLTARHLLTEKNFKLAFVDSTENLSPGQLYTRVIMTAGKVKMHEHDRPFEGCAVQFKINQVIKEKPFSATVYEDGKIKKNSIGKNKDKDYNLSCDKGLKKILKALPACQIVH